MLPFRIHAEARRLSLDAQSLGEEYRDKIGRRLRSGSVLCRLLSRKLADRTSERLNRR